MVFHLWMLISSCLWLCQKCLTLNISKIELSISPPNNIFFHSFFYQLLKWEIPALDVIFFFFLTVHFKSFIRSWISLKTIHCSVISKIASLIWPVIASCPNYCSSFWGSLKTSPLLPFPLTYLLRISHNEVLKCPPIEDYIKIFYNIALKKMDYSCMQ